MEDIEKKRDEIQHLFNDNAAKGEELSKLYVTTYNTYSISGPHLRIPKKTEHE